MYLTIDEISIIQIDHTTRCNLLCPQCARVSDGLLNKKVPVADLTIDDYKKIFEPFKGKPLRIVHCGNYGDVIASPTFDQTLDWCIDNGFNMNHIITNGSLRKPQWWAELARRIGPKSKVTFSVDGLSDTNHLYRVNSKFDKIIENMTAFISAGGIARWAFIVFAHNAHQVDEAEQMARQLGVKEFVVRNTSRFATTKDGINSTVKGKNAEIKVNDNNPNISDYSKILSEYGSFEEYARKTPISCKYKMEKIIYVDFDMRVWPCCWAGASTYFAVENTQTRDLARLYDTYGKDFNDLRIHSLEEILSSEFYASGLEKSWHDESTRLFVCGRTCGQKYESSSAADKNQIIKQL